MADNNDFQDWAERYIERLVTELHELRFIGDQLVIALEGLDGFIASNESAVVEVEEMVKRWQEARRG